MPISKSKNILKSVIDKIRDKNITVNDASVSISSQDITEGFSRPSFFVNLDNLKSENHMNNALERTGDIRISYFPSSKNKNQEEILDIQDTLREIFLENKEIMLENGSVIEINEVEEDVVDKILHFDFKFWLMELYERNTEAEMMEDIILNENIEN